MTDDQGYDRPQVLRDSAGASAEGTAREDGLLELLDQTSELICVSDATGNITYANRPWLLTLGYTIGEARTLRPADLVAPEHKADYLQVARRLNRGEHIDAFEAVLIARDGRRVVCRGRASTRKVGGTVIETRAVYRDVTDERRVEGVRARLAATLEVTTDFVSMSTGTGQIVFLNRAGHRLLDVPEDADLSIIQPGSLHPPAEWARLQGDAIPAAIRQGKWEGETVLLSANGDAIPVSIVIVAHPTIGPTEPAHFISTVMRDLRERARTEHALRESERRFRGILENLRLIAMILDVQGRVMFANDHLLHVTGWSRDEVVGEDWFSRFAPHDPARATLFATSIASNELPTHFESEIMLRSGARHRIEWDNVVLQDPDGRTIGMASVGRDVGAERRTQMLKDQLIATVSHELRSPLSAVRGALQLLAEDVGNEGRPRKMLDMATRNTDRVLRLTKNLLDIERVESGTLPMELVPVGVSRLLDDAIEVMSHAARVTGVTLQRTTPPPDDLSVLADADRIMQVLMNLINNAIKFSPAGSTISLGASRDGDMVRISVTDQGRGIPPEKLDTIFDRFTQVRATDAREKGGAGLGLAIARAIITSHHGRVWAESTEHAGSTFVLTLPRA